MHAAVAHGVVHAEVALGIHHAGEERPARRCEKAAHLDRERVLFAEGADVRRRRVEQRAVARLGIVAEALGVQPGAVFHVLRREAVLLVQHREVLVQMRELLCDHGVLALLRAGKVVDAHDRHVRELRAPGDEIRQCVGIHAELASINQPKQDTHLLF